MDSTSSTPAATEPKTRRRKTGIILHSSPLFSKTDSEDNPEIEKTVEGTTETTKSVHKTVRIAGEESTHVIETPRKRGVKAPAGKSQPAKVTDPREPGVRTGQHSHKQNGLFDAKSEKSESYLKSGGKAMKSSMLYQESVNRSGDAVENRRKLRQLQINYSKTNANLNDRVIMCDILKVTFNQVIPRIRLINSLERRLCNLRANSRRRVMATSENDQDVAKTIAELKKEREERIKNKQKSVRKAENLKEITAEDIQKLRTCRYLRVSDIRGWRRYDGVILCCPLLHVLGFVW